MSKGFKLGNLNVVCIAKKTQKTIFDKYISKSLKLTDLKIGTVVYGHFLPFKILDLCFFKNQFGREYVYWFKISLIDDRNENTLNGYVDYVSLSDHNITDGGYNPSLYFTDKKIASEYKLIYDKAIYEWRGRVNRRKWFSNKPSHIPHATLLSLGFKEITKFDK